MQIERMKVQGLFKPLGIGTKQPVFSYLLTGCKEESANGQSAFRLLCASSKELLEQNLCDLWDSGVCRQKETFGIQYAGKELQSGQIVYWKVMVWDQEEKSIGWSEISTWEMGLLSSKDWKGCWIGQGDDCQGKKERAPLFAKVFQVERKEEIVKARLYISDVSIW